MAADEHQQCQKPSYINRHNHDPLRSDHPPAPSTSDNALLYGNPYYSVLRPSDRTMTFHDWARAGFRHGLVAYPAFVDAKSGCIIVSERDNHRLQMFDNVGGMSRFDRSVIESTDGRLRTSRPTNCELCPNRGKGVIVISIAWSAY
jgi:hypothetical protein